MEEIKVYKLLPQNLIIKNANNYFYKIGLSLFSFGTQKPNPIFNQYFIFIFNFGYCLQNYNIAIN